jgi:hypothetical protein
MSVIFRTRTPRSGPETDLIEAALTSKFFNDGRHDALICREPQLPSGIPDVVAIYAGQEVVDVPETRWQLTSRHIKFLYLLYQTRGGSIQELSQMSLHSLRKVRSFIDDLFQAGMVYFREERVLPVSVNQLFAVRRIVAIEAKIKDWRVAIRQALSNKWFSSHSYILLPSSRNAVTVADEAGSFGIGLLVYSGNKLKVLGRAERQEIPASYGSWLLNGWAIKGLHSRGM